MKQTTLLRSLTQSKRRALIGCTSLVLLCPLLALVILLHNMSVHDVRLTQIADMLYGIPLPPQTAEVSRTAYVDNLGPTGDACDYVVEQTLESSLTRPTVVAYYHPTSGPSRQPDIRSRRLRRSGEYYAFSLDEHDAYLIILDQQPVREHLRFMLQIVDGRHEEPFDPRCG